MKQVSQNYKSGAIRLERVSQPALKSGGVLVRTVYSVISAGTEGMKVSEGKMNYLQKAQARPDQVKKVVQSVQQQGLVATYQKVMNRLDSLTPLGYSLAGEVVAVGAGVEEFTVGQQVACAGAGYANHAEVNFVPQNLVVPIPAGVALDHAAFATIGAIAMQGYRQAEMQLGERACVIGLGLVGQILVQILHAAGVRVLGVDISSQRCELAQQHGATFADTPENTSLVQAIQRHTDGYGVDCVFITAGGNTNQPVELAAHIARDRARIVDIGKTRLDLPWKEYYEKELDVRFSRSYGPGRYDPNYEEKGIDYPIGYVRWTERRNMQSFLELVATKQIDLTPIVSAVFPFEEAEQVYQEIADGNQRGLGILFRYGDSASNATGALVRDPNAASSAASVSPQGIVRLGVIGAGNYASSMLLPHLAKMLDVNLVEVATATGLSGQNATRKFDFQRASTDYQTMLSAQDISAVLIATRHNAHASMTVEALTAGKSVFVEKPLAVDLKGLETVRQTLVTTGNDRLQVGFNRRFSPTVGKVKELFAGNQSPLVMSYRVHAGQLESGSWYLDAEQGSRFIGEAGHFLDVFAYLTGSRPVSVAAMALHPPSTIADDLENLSVVVQYADGSVGNLLYLTQGAPSVPKEYLEVFGSGKTVQLHNFEYVQLFENNAQKKFKMGVLNKGQKEEMAAFVQAVRTGGAMPISTQELIDTTLLTLCAVEAAKERATVHLADYWD